MENEEKQNNFEQSIVNENVNTIGISNDEGQLSTLEVQNQETSMTQEVTKASELSKEVQKNDKERNTKKKGKKILIWILVVLLVAVLGIGAYILFNNKSENAEIKSETKQNQYRIKGNDLEEFDLSFLKLNNEEENKIYSPLSIKYALAMLNEGTDGKSNEEIKNLIGDYAANKYTNSANMTLANALFIKNTFKDQIQEDYKNKLIKKYNAEVILDDFSTPNNINNWVSKNTFDLINNLLGDVSDNTFVLVNALAIDMDWKEKFLHNGKGGISYPHEKVSGSDWTYHWYSPNDLVSSNFANMTEKISGMEIIASLNNYDIISELGEDNIRKTVGDELRKFLIECPDEELYILKGESYYNYKYSDDKSEEKVNQVVNDYLDEYIKEIKSNFGSTAKNTEFSFYTDENVKVFAKDLKEYNGTTLQYVGIMPVKENLNSYIKNVDSKELKALISNLKELKIENMEKGAITEIKGYIPKFKFDYDLDLMSDLKKLGINDVFDEQQANLSKITKSGGYISDVKHKANIEFTQDGIKAAAATAEGGAGAGGSFDYLYEVPIIRIDLTFNKPYMFLIRDKKTGEVWFTGTVYNPLLWKEDLTKSCLESNGCYSE